MARWAFRIIRAVLRISGESAKFAKAAHLTASNRNQAKIATNKSPFAPLCAFAPLRLIFFPFQPRAPNLNRARCTDYN